MAWVPVGPCAYRQLIVCCVLAFHSSVQEPLFHSRLATNREADYIMELCWGEVCVGRSCVGKVCMEGSQGKEGVCGRGGERGWV